MKLYRDASQASITMAHDPELASRLETAIRDHDIDVAIETGTHIGTGSTRTIAECFKRVKPPKTYISLEVNFESWTQACQNVREHVFVDCRWGCSVDVEKAIAFLKQDEMLNNHGAYPDIFIDDIQEPVGFYVKELRGALGRNFRTGWWGGMKNRERLWSGEDLLSKLLKLHRRNKPLVVLDSAGGCGWYEFQVTQEAMRDVPYLLLLDDTHHIKHYRSVEHIRSDSRFHMIGDNPHNGWALAWHE